MKITKFWAKGYRSLRDVTLEPLGDFNIFYGPNGAGKSNLLDALQTFFALLPIATQANRETITFNPHPAFFEMMISIYDNLMAYSL
jgi:AAA15 family ATPase/GTPase